MQGGQLKGGRLTENKMSSDNVVESDRYSWTLTNLTNAAHLGRA